MCQLYTALLEWCSGLFSVDRLGTTHRLLFLAVVVQTPSNAGIGLCTQTRQSLLGYFAVLNLLAIYTVDSL